MKKELFQTLWYELFIKSWWVWVISIASFGLYEQGAYQISKEMKRIEKDMLEIEQKIISEKSKRAYLLQSLESMENPIEDPAWIELELIQNLGLVPEGYQKIVYEMPRDDF